MRTFLALAIILVLSHFKILTMELIKSLNIFHGTFLGFILGVIFLQDMNEAFTKKNVK